MTARRIAGHTNSYHTYAFEPALAGIAAAGFETVELSAVPGWTEHLTLEEGEEVRRMLDGYGLEPVSLSAHSDLTTDEGLAWGVKAVRWAASFGVPVVNTAIGGHAAQEEDERAFLANVGVLADAASAAGVVLALETHGEIMASGAATAALLERIGRDDVKVNYDTANVEYYGGVHAVDDLPSIVGRLGHVHLKDVCRTADGGWRFPALGAGTVDVARVLEILGAAGYDGPCSVEIEFGGTVEPWPPLADVDEAMRRSHEHLRALGAL